MLHIKTKRLFSLCLIFLVTITSVQSSIIKINAQEEKKYIPGGVPFGVKLYSEGPYITGFIDSEQFADKTNPAQNAGVKLGDVICFVNETKIADAKTLSDSIKKSGDSLIKLRVKRDNKEEIISVKPGKCKDGNYRLGINLKDVIAGIGTITYYSIEDGTFGGLGHGICDSNTGSVIPIKKGVVYSVEIKNLIKGTKGIAGEMRGGFTGSGAGVINTNTDRGVFGNLWENFIPKTEPMPLAEYDNIKEGPARIICTLDSSGPQYYDISIVSIEKNKSQGTRNFVIRITDKNLISKTGGIIQGMSGSPIIQNNLLVGAVTHVMLNEPTMGYGIYIKNMLNATSEKEVGYVPASFYFLPVYQF